MPATRTLIAVSGLILAGCATPAATSEAEGADRLDEAVAARVRAGRDRGYPSLADVPAARETPADARALADDAQALAAEAGALRQLRRAANAPRGESPLPERARRLRREVAQTRARLDGQPPIARPAPE